VKFTVTIDQRTWDKCARLLVKQGITGAPAEVLETVLATGLSGEGPVRHVGDVTISSTSLMLSLGRIKVEQVPDDQP